MGLFGKWEKGYFCPNCYSTGDNFWAAFIFHCSKCKWSGPRNELLTKQQIRKRKLNNLDND